VSRGDRFVFVPDSTTIVTVSTCGLGHDRVPTSIALLDESCDCASFVPGVDEVDGTPGCATLRMPGSAGVPLHFAVKVEEGETVQTPLTVWTDDCAASFCSDAHAEAASRKVVPFGPAVHTALPPSLFATSQQLSCRKATLHNGKVMFSLDVPVSGDYLLSTCGTSSTARMQLALLDGECGCVSSAAPSWHRPTFDAKNGSYSIVGTTSFRDPSWLWCTSTRLSLVAGLPAVVAAVPASSGPADGRDSFSLQLYPAAHEHACHAVQRVAPVRPVGGRLFSGTVVSTDSALVLPPCNEAAATNEVHFIVEAPTGDANVSFIVCPTGSSTLLPQLSVHDAACSCVEVWPEPPTDDGCVRFGSAIRGPVVVGVSGRSRTTGSFTLDSSPAVRDNPCPYTDAVTASLPTVTCASSHTANLTWLPQGDLDPATYECDALTEKGPADVVMFVAPKTGLYLLTTCVPWPFPSPDTLLLLSDAQCRCVGGNDDFSRYDSTLGLYEYLFQPADRDTVVVEDDGDYDYSYFVDGQGEGEGEGTGFSPSCSGIEVNLVEGDRVILRTSLYGGPRTLSNAAVVRVAGPVCEEICVQEDVACDEFPFVRREGEEGHVNAGGVTGSVALDAVLASLVTLLVATTTVFAVRRYLQSKQAPTVA